jgi:ADP-ribose pyrophosphatase YjhB (NUDIX family)
MGDAIKGLFKALAHPIKWLSSSANRWRILGARVEVIACVLCRTPEPSILLGQSPYHSMWMPPQEGVNIKENFHNALLRCLKVECGLAVPVNTAHGSRKLHFRSVRFLGQVPLPTERRGERPIADDALGTWLESIPLRRKAYWMATVLVADRADIKPKSDGKELIDIAWYTIAEARNVISRTNHADKARLLLKLLDECEKDLVGATLTRLS